MYGVKTGAEETGDVDVVGLALESSNFSKNVTASMGQELCPFDDTTTRFGFFTTDVGNGRRRRYVDVFGEI